MEMLEELFNILSKYYDNKQSSSYIKELVKEFKDNIKKLDDDVFIDALEVIKEELDIKELDKLLSLDKYTEKEAKKVENMIDISSNIIANKLENKINEFISLYDKFQRD